MAESLFSSNTKEK